MSNLVDIDYAKATCKIGQGNACCRYLTAGPKGLECEKHTSLRATIDARVHMMVAQGDNCEGKQ